MGGYPRSNSWPGVSLRSALFLILCSHIVFFEFPRQYVDMKTSKDLNLTFASTNTFILRADNTEYLNPSGPGRKSVRIQSKKQYTKHVAMWVFLSTLHLEYDQNDTFWLVDLTSVICQKVVRELRIVQKAGFFLPRVADRFVILKHLARYLGGNEFGLARWSTYAGFVRLACHYS